MNIMNLIQQHPLLFADLKTLGLPTTTIRNVATQISTQLGGNADFNLCFVLSALDRREFIASVDVAAVARNTGLPASLVQSIVLTMSPWVDRFRMAQQVG